MIDNYGAAEFEALVGESFAVAEIDGLVLNLTEVDRRDLPGQEMFSVIFRGPATTKLEQATYKLANEKCGVGEIFIVPVRLVGEELEYEASFNRIVSK